jgi:hypothetical protein
MPISRSSRLEGSLSDEVDPTRANLRHALLTLSQKTVYGYTSTMASPDDKWKELCAQATVEQDPRRLLELITEINRILDQRENGKKTPAGTEAQ